MATGPRKPPTRRNAVAGRSPGVPKRRGRPPGKAAAARQATATPSKPAVQKKAAAGRAGGKAATLAAQVERINNGLDAITDLLSEVQGLRARFDAFTQRVEALLAARATKPRERVDPPQTEESRPPPVEEPHSTPFTASDDEDLVKVNGTLPKAAT